MTRSSGGWPTAKWMSEHPCSRPSCKSASMRLFMLALVIIREDQVLQATAPRSDIDRRARLPWPSESPLRVHGKLEDCVRTEDLFRRASADRERPADYRLRRVSCR